MPETSLAARFAAKEAIAKALGAPAGMSWQDATVRRVAGAQPVVEVVGTVAAAAAAAGVDLRPIADGSPFLQVRLIGREPPADDGRVAKLTPLAAHVLWLTLADTAITDAAFPVIAGMTNVTRLDVSRTAATDRALQALAPLAQLEVLNLYGTKVSDAGLASLPALPRLRRVYLWQTAVTPAGVERLRAVAPKLEVVLGDDAEGDAPTAAGSAPVPGPPAPP